MSDNTPAAPDTPLPKRLRTRAGEVGAPRTAETTPALAAAAEATEPSAEELDLLDQMKTGPRRQAGPPLEGDEPEAMPLAALNDDSMPEATDPEE